VEAIFHKTTASKIIKSQKRIVRTVEFTVLPRLPATWKRAPRFLL